jgi:hypothetical protein
MKFQSLKVQTLHALQKRTIIAFQFLSKMELDASAEHNID